VTRANAACSVVVRLWLEMQASLHCRRLRTEAPDTSMLPGSDPRLDRRCVVGYSKNDSDYERIAQELHTTSAYKRSRQRERILELLQGTGRHPTAAWLYDRLKEEFSNLSMGTVYRNLNILIEQGLVQKIDFGSTFDRFEAKAEAHYHFVCERCHRIIDLDLPVVRELEARVADATPYRVKRHQVEFFGICDECGRKMSEKE